MVDAENITEVIKNVTKEGFHTCSLMTGNGFENLEFLGPFSMAWLGLVILALILMFGRKWIGEEFGIPFSMIGGAVVGGLAYVLTITFTCSSKLALLLGLAGLAIGAYFGSQLLGEGGGGDGGY